MPAADGTAIEDAAAPGEDDAGADLGDPAPEAPALHSWTLPVDIGDRPGRDAYALRLVSGRVLYDGGVEVAATPAFDPLVRPGGLRVNPQDRDRIGVGDGDTVRVTSARGHMEIPVHADPTVPPGIAALAWNLPDHAAALLVDASASVTDLRVESMR